jgi:3'-phosphoadenosine 5'-phosphosulfate sulfotransferase (PAPS reductase)/FAD synthetase
VRVEIPAELVERDLLPVVSVSGGKDSTATILALREAEIEGVRYVFADTGWEAPETYAHLDTLEETIGITIDRIGRPGGMVGSCRSRAGFPARMQRWCTKELKLRPLRKYHRRIERDTGRDTVAVVGVRAGESEKRARMLPWEDDETWRGWMWRPLLPWAVEDVLAIHHRHGVPVNPLYQRGHDRVGCYPCIFASKADLKLLADHAPERIDQIRGLERELTELRAERNQDEPGRYTTPEAQFFQYRVKGLPHWIDDVMLWAQSSRGGRQLQLIDLPPDGGCFRWGLCEPPESA